MGRFFMFNLVWAKNIDKIRHRRIEHKGNKLLEKDGLL
ncbi:hypothetical protein SOHN41_02052 [Shewanella sp. HN-41]|nr:hypothetical protein SOHN41_02052 [Shewanella sp. HN-41]